jgi:ABC-type glycerol-3-phosphate transport system substrate-binding protein
MKISKIFILAILAAMPICNAAPDVSVSAEELLVLYTWAGRADDVKALLKKNPDININTTGKVGNPVITVAARNFILNDIASNNAKSTVMQNAAAWQRDQYGEIIKTLLQRGATYNPTFKTKSSSFTLPDNKNLQALITQHS